MIGKGDLIPLRQVAPQDGSIEFIGEVNDIIEYIAGVKVCIAPLISGAGFRGKLNQYVVAGKPVVSTLIGSCGLKYSHQKSMWITDDPKEFAKGIVHLLSNPQAYNEILAEAQKIVTQEYFWPGSIALLEKLYLSQTE